MDLVSLSPVQKERREGGSRAAPRPWIRTRVGVGHWVRRVVREGDGDGGVVVGEKKRQGI